MLRIDTLPKMIEIKLPNIRVQHTSVNGWQNEYILKLTRHQYETTYHQQRWTIDIIKTKILANDRISTVYH